jgi:uncharacterized protein YjbJ (UPF0337 family)
MDRKRDEDVIRDERVVKDSKHDSNPDPITGEPGAHPFGVAGGGTGGAAAGAAIGGVVGGPVGALVGGAVGAIAGGLAGKGAAEAVNPTEEETYWQNEYKTRPYYKNGMDYSHYQPAYRYGWENATKPNYMGRKFDEVEPELRSNWNTARGASKAEWDDVRHATRDAYDRVSTRMTGTPGMTHASETARDAGQYASDKGDAVWDQVKGNWHQFKGHVKAKWNDLTDDEIDQMQGEREKIYGKIQERYGEAKWKKADIDNEFRTWSKR